MKKIEYKFIKLPYIPSKFSALKQGKDKIDIRICQLEESFNSLGKDGWELMNIYWWEGMALFTREIQNENS